MILAYLSQNSVIFRATTSPCDQRGGATPYLCACVYVCVCVCVHVCVCVCVCVYVGQDPCRVGEWYSCFASRPFNCLLFSLLWPQKQSQFLWGGGGGGGGVTPTFNIFLPPAKKKILQENRCSVSSLLAVQINVCIMY